MDQLVSTCVFRGAPASVYKGGEEGRLAGQRGRRRRVLLPLGVGFLPPILVQLGLESGVLLSFPTSFFSFLFDFLSLAHRAFLGCPTSPLRAGVTPPNAYGLPRSGLPPSGELPEPIRHSRYIPGNSENLPVIK